MTRKVLFVWMLSLIASIAPITVFTLIIYLVVQATHGLQSALWYALFNVAWDPVSGAFGLLPLALTSLVLAICTATVIVPAGLLAATTLVFSARRFERRLCEAALNVMAGLPSVLVGLFCLYVLTPHTGFSILTGVIALSAMVFPTFTLILVATLHARSKDYFATGRALGMTDNWIIWNVCFYDARGAAISATGIAIARALGEATVVAMVIGKRSDTLIPDLLGPGQSLTTVILTDHAAAIGLHQTALYAAACLLGATIAMISIISSMLRHAIERNA